MSVLDKCFIKKAKNNLIFVLIYTLIFISTYKLFRYVAPFLLGGLIAFTINPIATKLHKNLRIDKGISTLILSFLGVSFVITVITIFTMVGLREAMNFLNQFTLNSDDLNNIIVDTIKQANIYIDLFQNTLNLNIEELVSKYSVQLIDIIKDGLRSVLSLVSSIPYIIIFVITLFIATYFIAKDTDKIETFIYNMFTVNTRSKVKNVKKEIVYSIVGYIRAYSILMFITFLIIWGSFSLFGVPYGLTLGIIGALLDLIPFLGIIVIYLPVIIYYFLVKNYFVAVSLIVTFIGISILRQVLEPKLVSVNIGINPLFSVAAIFIGVQVKGITGIIFFLGLVAMHNILKKVDIL